MSNFKKTLKFSFARSLPVMAGYLVMGCGFGIYMADKGYSFWWPVLMSTVIYAGSLQYVAVNLLSGMASPITALIMTLTVNARHVFYGISMLDRYGTIKKGKAYTIFALTDETYSLVCSAKLPDEVDEDGYYFSVSLLDQFYCVLGSLVGGLLGNFLSFNSDGIEFAMTALFLITFIEQWEDSEDHAPVLCGLFSTILCLIAFGANYFLIPSMVLIAIMLAGFKNGTKIGGKKVKPTND